MQHVCIRGWEIRLLLLRWYLHKSTTSKKTPWELSPIACSHFRISDILMFQSQKMMLNGWFYMLLEDCYGERPLWCTPQTLLGFQLRPARKVFKVYAFFLQDFLSKWPRPERRQLRICFWKERIASRWRKNRCLPSKNPKTQPRWMMDSSRNTTREKSSSIEKKIVPVGADN